LFEIFKQSSNLIVHQNVKNFVKVLLTMLLRCDFHVFETMT